MSGLFGSPGRARLPEPPPEPEPELPPTEQERIRRSRRGPGRASSILAGLLDEEPAVTRATLLGGSRGTQ